MDKLEKAANLGYLKGLAALGIGLPVGAYTMTHGGQALDHIGQGFSEHIYDPAYAAAYPTVSHVGEHAGKYMAGGLSLAAFLASRGRLRNATGFKSFFPLAATATASSLGGTWWDNSRRQAAGTKALEEQRLLMDKEKWRSWEDTEDPYELPSAPPGFGQTGWRPSDRPMTNLTP